MSSIRDATLEGFVTKGIPFLAKKGVEAGGYCYEIDCFCHEILCTRSYEKSKIAEKSD